MPAPKGHKKWGGRSKGTPNKNTNALFEACKKKGIDCWDELLAFCTHRDDKLRFDAVKEACSYLYAKRKAVEHSENPEAPIGKSVSDKHLATVIAHIDQALRERKGE